LNSAHEIKMHNLVCFGLGFELGNLVQEELPLECPLLLLELVGTELTLDEVHDSQPVVPTFPLHVHI